MTSFAWNAGGCQKNDRRSYTWGNSGLCGHGVFHVFPALFCDPLNPGTLKKIWEEPHGTPRVVLVD